MRLIHATTLQLESFEENAIPPYAILSHTWGADEVSFQEIQNLESAALKEGFAKIKFTCEEALERGLEYTWVDTCCIDKTSSAELSEAINSMFNWYKNARECYAYLSDVPDGTDICAEDSAFYRSRWFTRGWTLQELLAPKALYLFSSTFRCIGSGGLLAKELSRATGINEDYLTGESTLASASVSRRMSWASSRVTTRKEDLAYCLMGIFNINMPLLYGEGEKSFQRLQEEIIKTSDDQTIFAWSEEYNVLRNHSQNIFAKSPSCFRLAANLIPDELSDSADHYYMTNKGLRITLPVMEERDDGLLVAILACRNDSDLFSVIALPIIEGSPVCARGAPYIHEIPRFELEDPNTTIENLTFYNNLKQNLGTRTIISNRTRPFLIRKLPDEIAILRVDQSGGYDEENRIIQRGSKKNGPIRVTLHSHRNSFKAVVEIHCQAPKDSEDYHKLCGHPNAFVKVFDARGIKLDSFDADDPAALRATLLHETRLSFGAVVVILDIQFITQTDEARRQRNKHSIPYWKPIPEVGEKEL